MNNYEDYGEEELNDYIFQLSIQDSCQEAFLKSAASLTAATDENLRVLAAIEQGEVPVLREMLRHTFAFREPDSRGWLPLHRAASQPVLEVLETVLRLAAQGLSLEERTAVGRETPLTLAVKAGLVHNVKSLLEHRASPHNTNSKNESPLLLAVRVGSYDMTCTLVANGAWVEQVCWRKWTAMHEAAKLGNVDILMLLLRNGGRVNQKDMTGVTPLAVAAEHGHFHVTEILLNCGSRVNAQAFNGESVLLDAAGSGNTACIQLLLDNGANPNLPSITGNLPIHKAAYAGHYDALKMLIPLTTKKAIKEAGQSPVHSAAEGGQSCCLQLLLAYGFDVNYRMNTRNSENYRDMRRSALYFAVSNGDVDCTKILLAAGAKTDLDPLCCLLVAVRSGHYEIVKLLLAAKAVVNCYFTVVSDTMFPTALQYCLKDEVMMRLLLNNGYKVERCFHCHHNSSLEATDDVEAKIPVSDRYFLTFDILGNTLACFLAEFDEQFCGFMSLCCLMHLSGSVVRILLDYVSHVHICSKLRLILEKQKEWAEICEILFALNLSRLFMSSRGMDTADDTDEDELLDYDVQMIIQESCQREHLTRSGRGGALKLADAIGQGDMLALQELCDFPAAFSQVDECGWYLLHRAAVQPLVSVLETVLYASFSLTLEEQTPEGETFLTLAVKAGLVKNVKILLDHGASPHTTNSKNESPLLLAVRAGSHQMVSGLITGGALVEQVCLKKWTAMHEASRAGCVHIMELLLQNGGKVLEPDQHGVTPLGIAAEYSHPEVLELLIKHGADVNAQAPNGDSVLYDAAGSGNPDCIDILLQHGANPNILNLSFQLPIHRAAYEGRLLALRILIPITTRRALRLSGHSPVHSAADGGHAHCLELLLQKGFDVNVLLAPHISENYGDMRRSPLYFTVSNGDATCTKILLKSGAKPDLDPLRCLLVAVRSGYYEIVKLLLAAKADVNCYFTVVNDTMFPTALQYCMKDEVMMRLLLNNGYNAEKCFYCNHDDNWDELIESDAQHQEEKVAFCDFVSVSWLVNLAGRVVSILLEYVGPVSLCDKLTKILEKHKEWHHIHRSMRNPCSLSHLSRVVVRKHLSCSNMTSIQLPNRLKDYLLFKDNDLYSRVICREN
ncbi:putative ankyrin repeat and SOCS box protein 15 [Scophthalmus maximus]|uniref:Putative ankyrin repeat and SOCS box protein 15 n=1 Tax=Scophthalmus maximus TaxID=52904 RepID=A0A2U9BXL5_SCOMX|nr:putative ankyrin repeat and SOCS box protein 15 [Scophthalmus maximus]